MEVSKNCEGCKQNGSTMVVLYIVAAILILSKNIGEIPRVFQLIMADAFTGNSVSGELQV